MKKLRVLIIALLIVMLATPASFAAGSRSDNDKGELNTCYIKVDRYYDYAFEMLELINEVRTEEGVRPLKMDKALLDAAMMRAGESAVFFSHTRPNNTDNDTAIEGVVFLENLHGVSPTAKQAMDGLKKSAPHWDTLMMEEWTSVGVGVVYHNNTFYWAQIFGWDPIEKNCSQPANDTIVQEIEFATSVRDINENRYNLIPELEIMGARYGSQNPEMCVGQMFPAKMGIRNPLTGTFAVFEDNGISWKYSGDCIKMDSGRNVTGVKLGTGTVSAVYQGKTYTETITVVDHELDYRYANNDTHRVECENCDYKTTETCTYDRGVIVQQPSEDYPGRIKYTCTKCKVSYTENYYPEEPDDPVVPDDPVDPDDPSDETGDGIDGVWRIYGSDRFATSLQAANVLKEDMGVSKFDNIVIASGMTFADALPGSYLAAEKNAPVMLIGAGNASEVKTYVNNNLKSGGTVYVLGGTAVIPDSWVSGMPNVKRLGGKDRYSTNLLILNEVGVKAGSDILVCTGLNFADSLSASATGLPILLVGSSLNDAQKEYLGKLSGDEAYFMIGGTGAVSDRVKNECAEYGLVNRLAGNNRYDTSAMVAETFFGVSDYAVLAYGLNFPDGLSAGPLAYNMKSPLILTATGSESQAAAYAKAKGIKSGYVIGGEGLISDTSARTIFQITGSNVVKVK